MSQRPFAVWWCVEPRRCNRWSLWNGDGSRAGKRTRVGSAAASRPHAQLQSTCAGRLSVCNASQTTRCSLKQLEFQERSRDQLGTGRSRCGVAQRWNPYHLQYRCLGHRRTRNSSWNDSQRTSAAARSPCLCTGNTTLLARSTANRI